MGFGQSFVGWVNLFYNNVSTSINVNGYIQILLSYLVGVRQGCPLSPLLYVLVAKVFACNIRSRGLISGLSLLDSSSCLPAVSAYADDTTLVVSSGSWYFGCL